MKRFRPTIRLRLTAFFTLLFVLLGAMMLTAAYLKTRDSLERDEQRGQIRRVTEQYGYTEAQVDLFNKVPLPPGNPEAPRRANNVGEVIFGVQRDIKEDALHELLVGSVISLGVMVAAAALMGWLAAGRVTRSLRKLTARAKDLSQENLDERLNLEGPHDELKELADTLDGMLGRLEVAFDAQRSLSAHVSHELRTPISIIRGEADLTLADVASSPRERELAATVRAAAVRTEALLDSLLALARAESTMNERERVDVADLAGDVIGEWIERADAAQIEVDLTLTTAVVRGDRFLLQRLIANLVDNAIKHNRSGGWLRLEVATEGTDAVITVTNTGDLIDDDQIAEITKPFQRIDDRRPGYGLGTMVVQSVVTSHGGTFAIAARPEGGLVITVHLPLDSGEAAPTDPDAGTLTAPRGPSPAPVGSRDTPAGPGHVSGEVPAPRREPVGAPG